MGIKTVPHPPNSSDLAPCDFWLFSKLRGCCYETTEEMKEAVTTVIDTLTQEDFHESFQKLLKRCAHTKKSPETYLMILVSLKGNNTANKEVHCGLSLSINN